MRWNDNRRATSCCRENCGINNRAGMFYDLSVQSHLLCRHCSEKIIRSTELGSCVRTRSVTRLVTKFLWILRLFPPSRSNIWAKLPEEGSTYLPNQPTSHNSLPTALLLGSSSVSSRGGKKYQTPVLITCKVCLVVDVFLIFNVFRQVQ